MARYIDGFLIAVPKKGMKTYKKMAEIGKKTWMKHGALDYYECVGANLKSKWGVPFPKLTKLKGNEVLIFAFVVYKSKAHRDQVDKKVHKEFSQMEWQEMPFKAKRFSTGEFKAFVHS